jgi:hypothetical protein
MKNAFVLFNECVLWLKTEWRVIGRVSEVAGEIPESHEAGLAVVVELPPKCGPGTVDDAFFRFVVDMCAPGLDRGAGGNGG